MTVAHIDLTPEVLDDLDRTLLSMADKSAIGRIAALARAAAPHVSEETRGMIERGLEGAPETPAWAVLYADATDANVAVPEVPGESTLEDRGSFAFEHDVIRRLIRIHDGALDLRRWLAIVPAVHATFALSGARKTVAQLQSTTLEPNDALLDAFAQGMAAWSKENDPALELSATALP